MRQRPTLRKREIVFAVAMGAAAAGAGALVLELDDAAPMARAATADHLTYPVGPFEALATVGPQDVTVERGDTYAVRSQGDPAALGQLEVVVVDGTLTIRPKPGFRVSWSSLSGATFHVTTPQLDSVSIAGSGSVRLDRVEGAAFAGSVAGPGELTIDALQVDKADFSVSGPGNLVAAGTAREARVSIAGPGQVRANALRSQTASVSIGGPGDAALTVTREARVSMMGSGDVAIGGTAHCSVTRMGSGSVHCDGDEVR